MSVDHQSLLAERDAEIEALKARLAEVQEVADKVILIGPEVLAFRGYLNKLEGNEHSRVIDVVAADADEAQNKILALRNEDEVVEQIASITVSPEHPLV